MPASVASSLPPTPPHSHSPGGRSRGAQARGVMLPFLMPPPGPPTLLPTTSPGDPVLTLELQPGKKGVGVGLWTDGRRWVGLGGPPNAQAISKKYIYVTAWSSRCVVLPPVLVPTPRASAFSPPARPHVASQPASQPEEQGGCWGPTGGQDAAKRAQGLLAERTGSWAALAHPLPGQGPSGSGRWGQRQPVPGDLGKGPATEEGGTGRAGNEANGTTLVLEAWGTGGIFQNKVGEPGCDRPQKRRLAQGRQVWPGGCQREGVAVLGPHRGNSPGSGSFLGTGLARVRGLGRDRIQEGRPTHSSLFPLGLGLEPVFVF